MTAGHRFRPATAGRHTLPLAIEISNWRSCESRPEVVIVEAAAPIGDFLSYPRGISCLWGSKLPFGDCADKRSSWRSCFQMEIAENGGAVAVGTSVVDFAEQRLQAEIVEAAPPIGDFASRSRGSSLLLRVKTSNWRSCGQRLRMEVQFQMEVGGKAPPSGVKTSNWRSCWRRLRMEALAPIGDRGKHRCG